MAAAATSATDTDALASLPDSQKQKANAGIGAAFEAGFGDQIKLAFPDMPALQRDVFGASLKTGFRAKLGGIFGVTEKTGVGVGGSVGGAASLKFAVGFSAGSAAAVKVGFSAAASAKLKANLDGVIAQGLLSAGLTAQQRVAVSAQIKPQLENALDDGARSSLGPSPAYPSGTAHPVIRAELTLQLHKEWDADVELDVPDDKDPPTGPFVLNMEGVEFRGTIIPARSGRYGGRTRIRVVGGAGGLTTELPPKNYAGGVIKVRTVVLDILRESGESLSPDAKDPILDQQLPGWQRGAGKGRDHLTRLGDKVGANWRVLRDGTVWFGTEGWAELDVSADPVVEEHHGDGFMMTAPTQPLTYPGTVIRGQRIEQVVHRLEDRQLRSEHHASSFRGGLRKFGDEQRRELDFTKRYPATVVTQNADGTLDVTPDDPLIKGTGLGHCAIYVGLPGTKIKVPQGTRCLVAFAAGDPSRAYVDGWLMGTTFTSIDFG